MSNDALDKWIWVLIYGGLLAVCLGLFVKEADPVLGWWTIGLGAAVTFIGAMLVYVRSRRG
jgi:uncharacterized membrane protein